MQEIFFLVTGRNILSLQLINCHRKKIIVTERNLLPKADISCHKKNFFVAGTNVLFEAEITCQRKIFLGIRGHFLSQTVTYGHRKEFHATVSNFLEEISCQSQKCPVTGRYFFALEEISCHRNKLLVAGRNFLPQLKKIVTGRISCHRKKLLFKALLVNGWVTTFVNNMFNTQITTILNAFCRVWLPLFRAKFLAESIGSHEAKYFIPPWVRHSSHVSPTPPQTFQPLLDMLGSWNLVWWLNSQI